jgi:hypothetical protein
MAEYRFFGSESVLADRRELTKYGEIVNLDQADADRLIAAHPPALLLPADLWNEIFTPGAETDIDLSRFPSVAIHSTAPEPFRVKTAAVRKAWHKYRDGLQAQFNAPPEKPKAAPPVEGQTAAAEPDPDS